MATSNEYRLAAREAYRLANAAESEARRLANESTAAYRARQKLLEVAKSCERSAKEAEGGKVSVRYAGNC